MDVVRVFYSFVHWSRWASWSVLMFWGLQLIFVARIQIRLWSALFDMLKVSEISVLQYLLIALSSCRCSYTMRLEQPSWSEQVMGEKCSLYYHFNTAISLSKQFIAAIYRSRSDGSSSELINSWRSASSCHGPLNIKCYVSLQESSSLHNPWNWNWYFDSSRKES